MELRRFNLPESTDGRCSDGACAAASKGFDTDMLREMVGYVAQRLMELDVEGLCAAAHS